LLHSIVKTLQVLSSFRASVVFSFLKPGLPKSGKLTRDDAGKDSGFSRRRRVSAVELRLRQLPRR
jgi:hypothetical protein